MWIKPIITSKGLELLAQAQAENKKITIINCKTSSHQYSESDLSSLIDLEDIKQVVNITEKSNKANVVNVRVNITNNQVLEEYSFRTFGLFARIEGGTDTLFAVSIDNEPQTVPINSATLWENIFNINIPISNTSLITINIDYAAQATQEWVVEKIQSYKIITLPQDDTTDSPYTEETDSDNQTYYTIEINVEGMTEDYVGTGKMDYVRPEPFNINTNEARLELFNTILNIESLNGKVKLYLSEKPQTSLEIILYGI